MSFKTKVFTIIFFVGFNVSCQKWFISNNCGDIEPTYFNIIGFDAITLKNRNGWIAPEDTANLGRLQLQFNFQMEYHSYFRAPKNILNFGSTAYACSPIQPGSKGSKTERFEEITLISLYDFNEDYKAQDTITKIIDLSLGGPENPSTYYFGNNLDESATGPYSFLEIPTYGPSEQVKPFQLKAIIKLNTGEEYEAFSPLIYLDRSW